MASPLTSERLAELAEHSRAWGNGEIRSALAELLERRNAESELFFIRYQLLGRTHLAGPDHWNALHGQYVEILNLEGASCVEMIEAAEVMRR